jgi:hypothetical protein
MVEEYTVDHLKSCRDGIMVYLRKNNVFSGSLELLLLWFKPKVKEKEIDTVYSLTAWRAGTNHNPG